MIHPQNEIHLSGSLKAGNAPKPRSVCCGKRSIICEDPTEWNSLADYECVRISGNGREGLTELEEGTSVEWGRRKNGRCLPEKIFGFGCDRRQRQPQIGVHEEAVREQGCRELWSEKQRAANEVKTEQRRNERVGGNVRSPRKPADQQHCQARFPLAKILERPRRKSNPGRRRWEAMVAIDLEAGVQATPKVVKGTGEDMPRDGVDSCHNVGLEFFSSACPFRAPHTMESQTDKSGGERGGIGLVCSAAHDTIRLEHRLNARGSSTRGYGAALKCKEGGGNGILPRKHADERHHPTQLSHAQTRRSDPVLLGRRGWGWRGEAGLDYPRAVLDVFRTISAGADKDETSTMPYAGFEPRTSRISDRRRTNRMRHGRSARRTYVGHFSGNVLPEEMFIWLGISDSLHSYFRSLGYSPQATQFRSLFLLFTVLPRTLLQHPKPFPTSANPSLLCIANPYGTCAADREIASRRGKSIIRGARAPTLENGLSL
ncbi:hypothetical protein PR048_019118 [Dryococelus australis]|uniref:Uncharacterized protein n=1 Tax=Dryococelus australis TaxID=614101 RepID=A0ABQ9H2P1_9NEOP|nr:hypothetical protein PR048_019118 [Dryococelus australis]